MYHANQKRRAVIVLQVVEIVVIMEPKQNMIVYQGNGCIMSFFYSPFTDKRGKPLDISHIRYHHLGQLLSKEVEEGYQIEYKTSLTDSVKKKIPKIITSFANSSGGWLFIGVDEKAHELNKLEKPIRTDYNQIISQLLREHVSPLPRFQARFFCPKGSTYGVLAIYIYEGSNPPYVADGTVYIRNGSSSEPAKSQRAEIDMLFQKSKDFESKRKDFCRRELYYPMDDKKNSQQVVLCNIYIMNTANPLPNNSPNHLSNLAKNFTSLHPNQFCKYNYSNGSVVFYNSKQIGKLQLSIVFEIFFDYSAKMHIPLMHLNNSERNVAIKRISRISGQTNVDDFLLLDGYSTCQCFQFIVRQYFQFLKKENIDLSSFIYQMSLEEAENSILYFDSEPYETYIKKHDIPYCCKNALHTPLYYFYRRPKKDYKLTSLDLLLDLFFMFGLDPIDATDMYIAAIDANPVRNITFT